MSKSYITVSPTTAWLLRDRGSRSRSSARCCSETRNQTQIGSVEYPIHTQNSFGIKPKNTQNQIGFIPKDTQRDFGYKLGIRPVSPLDFGINQFLWMLIKSERHPRKTRIPALCALISAMISTALASTSAFLSCKYLALCLCAFAALRVQYPVFVTFYPQDIAYGC